MKTNVYLFTTIIILTVAFAGCSNSGAGSADLQNQVQSLQTEVTSLKNELQKVNNEKALIDKRLSNFDKLDFDYFTGQQWEKFNESHDDNIVVHYPDGSTTDKLYPDHIDMLKPQFTFAPDTRIKQHPIRFGTGEWTAVVGEMEGTFSQPMTVGEGKTVPPTGRKFKLSMVTIGRWKGDKMTEEYLFYDNQAFMKQIGLGN